MSRNRSHTKSRPQVTPDLLWSKFSLLQHALFWVLGIVIWWGLHFLASNFGAWTLPIWKYVSRIRFYLFTGDFNHEVIRGIFSGAIILLIITGIDLLIAKIKGERAATQILRNHYLLPRTNKQRVIAVVLGINAGIFEEIFFRGGVFFLLLFLSHSTIIAILITSAIFALLHASVQGWYSTLIIFFVGIVLNVMLLLTDSFYAPMLCHITINLGNLLVIPSFFEEDLPEIQKGSRPSDTTLLEP